MSAPLLDVHVQRKAFGTRTILADVQLQVQLGETIALVGASGCGKSSLLRIASGLDRAYTGQVTLAGQPVTRPTRDIRFIFQEPRLFPWLTVAQNIAFDEAGRRPHQAQVEALLDEVGLSGYGKHLPKALSGGQAQRVAIARGLYTRPRVLLLDEPFSAVDAFTRVRLQELLRRVTHTHGITVLIVTHDIDEAVVLGDRVVVLQAAPSRITDDLAVPIPRPRDREAASVVATARRVREALAAAHAL